METHCKISGIGTYLPSAVLLNEDLEKQFPDFKAAKIVKKIGIRQRHIAALGETSLDMGEQAAKNLFSTCPEAKDADFLLFCTQSPDHFLPTGACILQTRLGMSSATGAFDYNLGCSGFVYGLATAKGLLAGGIASSVLLITAETYSKYLDPEDKGNRSIFGDGAAAVLISSCEEEHFGKFVLGTDGRGCRNLIVKNGGARHRTDGSPDDKLYMNGPEIFNFTIEVVPRLVSQVLSENNMTFDQIDHFVFHQANKYMLSYLGMKIGIPENKFHIDMEDTGNTVSASIPILLEKLQKKGVLHRGDRILVAGFGVGYSYGIGVVTW